MDSKDSGIYFDEQRGSWAIQVKGRVIGHAVSLFVAASFLSSELAARRKRTRHDAEFRAVLEDALECVGRAREVCAALAVQWGVPLDE